MDLERHAAREQASQWLAKLERGLRLDEGPALRKWLQPIAHRTAILEVARQRAAPDVMALLSELIPITLTPGPQAPPRGPTGVLVCIAAAAVVLITATWAFNNHRFVKMGETLPPMTRGDFSTANAQQREIRLSDGTTMLLNTASRVTVFYSKREREVYLAQGEASFNVAHDADRPFTVRAGRNHRLQATGTRFDVRLITPDTVELIVAEGQVTVLYASRDAPDTPAYLRLSNNMTSEDTTIDALEVADVEPGLHFVHKIDATDLDGVLARNYHLPAERVSGGRILLKNGST
jgi:transmembrane sensor